MLVLQTIELCVCVCLFQAKVIQRRAQETAQAEVDNIIKVIYQETFFSLLLPLTPRTSNFKTKSNFLTSCFFFFLISVSLYLPTFCWFNHCCSGLKNYHYKKPVFVTQCLLPLWKQRLTVFAELVSRVFAHLPTDSVVVYMFFPFPVLTWNPHTTAAQCLCMSMPWMMRRD